MSENRKKALVIYMAALFGLAFLIVSISLGIQIKKNTVNATSAEKVVALQNEIQTLKNEKKALQKANANLEENLADIMESLEFLEGIAYESTARISGQERLLEIKGLIIDYQQALLNEDEEAAAEHLEELKDALTDAQPLDTDTYEFIKSLINKIESETDE